MWWTGVRGKGEVCAAAHLFAAPDAQQPHLALRNKRHVPPAVHLAKDGKAPPPAGGGGNSGGGDGGLANSGGSARMLATPLVEGSVTAGGECSVGLPLTERLKTHRPVTMPQAAQVVCL